MNKTITLLPTILLALAAIGLGPRMRKDIKKKLAFTNTYAIQNIENGKDIRVHDAGTEDGRKIILYDHHNWECITWQFIQLEDGAFLLKNLYTQKAFQAASAPKPGVTLKQATMGGTPLQYWELLEQPDGNHKIRLRGTELYITTPSSETNSDIVLMPEDGSKKQLWKLIRQSPWV